MESNSDFNFKRFDLLTTKAHRKGMEMHQFGAHPTQVSMLLTVVDREHFDDGNNYCHCRIEHVGHQQSLSDRVIRLHEGELTDDLSPVEPEKKDA